MSEIQEFLDKVYGELRGCKKGKVADYIPQLAKVDPDLFGISVCTIDGEFYSIGGFFDQVVPLDKNGKVIEPEFKEHFYEGNALTHALFFGENVNNVLLKQIMDQIK